MGYIPFGTSPRLCSKPFTGVQCLEVLSCNLRPVFTRNRLLVYNVLKCYLAVFAPFLLETVYRCTMSWSVILLASPRLCPKPLTGVQCLEVLSCDLRPAIARNRLLVYNVLKCYLAVFAPSLFVTSTVIHCPGMSSKRAKGTIFSKSASFASASYKEKTHARKCKAAKTKNTKIHWTLNKLTAKTTNKYKKTANHFAVSI